jgi:hypothetical protein
MRAFIKTPDGLYKIYDQGDDWQVIGPESYERWYSKWHESSIRAQLNRAVQAIPHADRADLVICN